MLRNPAISQDHIAFVYANDLWVADIDGSNPRRLTVDEGEEGRPFFSPDGKHIAFSAEYDGNVDVFLVPVEGGVPERLTWHPGYDLCAGFTVDGSEVLFLSQRSLHTRRYMKLFTIPLEGGPANELVIPNANHACYSPDGTKMVYSPGRDAFTQWKNYRGGTISRLWVFDMQDYSHREIPKPEGGCNDVHPMWIGDKIYFLSDRKGEFNLYVYDVNSEVVEQLTDFQDFPILYAHHHGEKIIYERSGYLHTFDIDSRQSARLTVGIAADLQELRPRYVKGSRYIREAAISPSGARAVFNFRGEIITLPSEKGDPRNITLTTGANEKHPAWSPDGKSIACVSDVSGEYALHILPQDGRGEARVIGLDGTGFYGNIHWSPDSEKLTLVDNGRNYYLVDVAGGTVEKIDADELYIPGDLREIHGDWSSDSKWLAYTKMTGTFFQRVYLYNIEERKSFPVTDGLSDAVEPVFDREGKYLYFLASTDAGPVVNWFQQSTHDMDMTRSIYLAVLSKDTPSPFVKESDEEEIASKSDSQESDGEEESENGGENSGKSKKKKKSGEEDADKEEDALVIHTDGIQNRILAVPVDANQLWGLQCAKADEILYIKRDAGKNMLFRYDLKERKEEDVAEMGYFRVSADGRKMLWNNRGQWGISDAGAKPKPDENLNTGALQVKIDPKAEWPQIFEEAWRINRDYFYDPGMHGADWQAEKEKYAQFLPHLSCRGDLNRVVQWMCSELGVGHHRTGGGDNLTDTENVGGGLLGADFSVVDGRYRIDRIFEGLNWNPDLRSPLTEPGLNVKPGEYLLKVNGMEVRGSDNLYSFFENTSGKIVELTLSPDAQGTGARNIEVVPVGDESALRNRDWVEGNLKKVTEATNGQVAYVYVPNTTRAGHEYFKRYFFPQADRKAIIVDERYNAGGLIADYYIDILRRPYQSHWNMRYGKDLKSPRAAIQGPKVMIIDENAGSGGDMLPYMFRKFGVGTLVGTRTWGGLVGTLGYPSLMDGGYVTAPNVAIWTMEEGFCVENVGVPPDIEVVQDPARVIAGHDPQLEKAIEVVLQQLRDNPPVEYIRPPFPVRGNR